MVSYPAELPITERREDIMAAIRDHQVVVVSGETGSGKTTQLPKMCLELGLGVEAMIGHTQPRRLAARTVAERIASELDTEVGDLVGYAVRFTDRVSASTRIKLMTDGLLLAELHRDRRLRAYDALIIDEAHERSLNIDFLLGVIRDLLPARPELKIVITSATIDTERFAAHFGGAPIIEVSGRTYPVEMRYRPIAEESDQVQAIADAVNELAAEGPGDVLVFLSGEREIRDTADYLASSGLGVLPLYARLSAAEQHRVFAPHEGRRVVLATNVAETSLTVPGIRYVVDAGTARISRFNRRTKVQRLPIERISQASANQRAGRCGRVAPGICIRLYSEEDYEGRAEFTEPEILRTNLASVILQMAALDLGDVASFPFVDPPDGRAIRDGIALLEEIGALNPGLTRIGRQVAQLPIDPRYGRMLIQAASEGALRELLIITAGLSIQDPRERPVEHRDAAHAAHARFTDPASDFMSILNLWRHLQERQEEMTSSRFRRLCRTEYLNYLRVREWQDLHAQLRRAVRSLGFSVNDTPAPVAAIHRSALAGLLSHVGMRDPTRPEYRGARDARFAIASGSALGKSSPKWVVAAELVETNRTWARVAAGIEPSWAEELGTHLVRRSYGDPEWDRRRGAAVTDERVTLFGLPLVTARAVDYSQIDPAVAREMFLRHGLVEADWERDVFDFQRQNADLVEQISVLEIRARRSLYVGDDALIAHYDRCVDADVASLRAFQKVPPRRRRRLALQLTDLISPDAAIAGPADYPDTWKFEDTELALGYVFEPGADDDGVHVDIPLALLPRIDPAPFVWLVPGLRAELVAALLRTLPKTVRRDLGPADTHAARFLAAASNGPLIPQLASFFEVPIDAWRVDTLPAHLRMTFRVIGADGKAIAAGPDLPALQRRFAVAARGAIATATGWQDHLGQKAWTFGALPRVVSKGNIRGYPSLVDEGATVGAVLWPTPEDQAREMWAGTARLLALSVSLGNDTRARLTNEARLALTRAGYRNASEVLDDCLVAAVDRGLALHGGPVWSPEEYSALAASVRDEVAHLGPAVVGFVSGILVLTARLHQRLDRLIAPALIDAATDMREQIEALVYPRFAQTAGPARLPDVLRYLRAVDRRLDTLAKSPERDRARMEQIRALAARYERAAVSSAAPAAEQIAVRWMLEELRVSEFAQTLGTPAPISAKRVDAAIRALVSR